MEKAHKYRHLIDNSSKFSLADTAETERETIVIKLKIFRADFSTFKTERRQSQMEY